MLPPGRRREERGREDRGRRRGERRGERKEEKREERKEERREERVLLPPALRVYKSGLAAPVWIIRMIIIMMC